MWAMGSRVAAANLPRRAAPSDRLHHRARNRTRSLHGWAAYRSGKWPLRIVTRELVPGRCAHRAQTERGQPSIAWRYSHEDDMRPSQHRRARRHGEDAEKRDLRRKAAV